MLDGALDREGAAVRAGGGGGEKGKHEQRAIHSGICGKGYEPQVRASSDFVTAAFAGGTGSALPHVPSLSLLRSPKANAISSELYGKFAS